MAASVFDLYVALENNNQVSSTSILEQMDLFGNLRRYHFRVTLTSVPAVNKPLSVWAALQELIQ